MDSTFLNWVEHLAWGVSAVAIVVPILLKMVLLSWKQLVYSLRGSLSAQNEWHRNEMRIEIKQLDGTTVSIVLPPEGMTEDAMKRFVQVAKEATDAEAEAIPTE